MDLRIIIKARTDKGCVYEATQCGVIKETNVLGVLKPTIEIGMMKLRIERAEENYDPSLDVLALDDSVNQGEEQPSLEAVEDYSGCGA